MSKSNWRISHSSMEFLVNTLYTIMFEYSFDKHVLEVMLRRAEEIAIRKGHFDITLGINKVKVNYFDASNKDTPVDYFCTTIDVENEALKLSYMFFSDDKISVLSYTK